MRPISAKNRRVRRRPLRTPASVPRLSDFDVAATEIRDARPGEAASIKSPSVRCTEGVSAPVIDKRDLL